MENFTLQPKTEEYEHDVSILKTNIEEIISDTLGRNIHLQIDFDGSTYEIG